MKPIQPNIRFDKNGVTIGQPERQTRSLPLLDATGPLRRDLAEAMNELEWAEIRLARLQESRKLWLWVAVVLAAALAVVLGVVLIEAIGGGEV